MFQVGVERAHMMSISKKRRFLFQWDLGSDVIDKVLHRLGDNWSGWVVEGVVECRMLKFQVETNCERFMNLGVVV